MERTRRRITRQALAAMCHAGASCNCHAGSSRNRHAGSSCNVTCEVADGPVAHEIARRAAELDSDLIVVGKPGRSNWFGDYRNGVHAVGAGQTSSLRRRRPPA